MDTFQRLFTPEVIAIIVVIILAFLVLIFLMVFGILILIKKHNFIKYTGTATEENDQDLSKIPVNKCYNANNVEECVSKILHYSRNKVIYISDIGEGAFGRVFKAHAPGIIDGDDTLVAVKVLKADGTEEMQQDFEREAELMTELQHKNIVSLLGICTVGKPMFLLFEYMNKGDLNDFLRQCSPEHFISRQRSTESLTSSSKLSHLQLIHISHEVCEGMVYLSDCGYVHRDLATRNCLVSHGLVVKISDFGLTRKLEKSYYEGSDNDAIAVRWMPLESIIYNVFTTQSDVWSFGVVLWEIFSFALKPYYDKTHEQVVIYIKEQKILLEPENTPANIYSIMKQCWAYESVERPTFLQLKQQICNIMYAMK